jgi:uncharacterized protein (DUF58 family)
MNTLAATARPNTAPSPRWALRRRLKAWWLSRLPATDTCTLTQRNIYILPTRGGMAFALLVVLLLVGSINFQLNLGYALTFLLAGCGLVSMHITHGVLRGLTLHLRPAPAVFAGDAVLLEVVMTNPGGDTRHSVGLRYQERRSARASSTKKPPTAQERRRADSSVWCDVPAQGQASTRLSLSPQTRGWHAVPMLVVETRFPFGLFRAWSVWRPSAQVLAWPKPERPAAPLPPTRAAQGEPLHAVRAEGSELDGVRAWRRGDTMRQVVWKKAARTGELVSRETTYAGSHEMWLDWHGTQLGDGEERLSRLAAWVQAAEQDGRLYGLRLPGKHVPPGQGDSHRRALLEVLALWR